ncbi:trans-L-3-hydroxyproline dehydratase-like [Pecten maximus]|uniref:trans-L-3-hydroxyproline dehydratase-like n=1 Tax=Pecten maximus TaxID=6579 RepID=UPI001458C519|nr:trans-L-3-hydroxyproline dehydratase-like [Pecten maximus]
MAKRTPNNVLIKTKEMHTGGEPLRIVEAGFPAPKGDTILDKIRYTREHLDPYRKLLMSEPRGHRDMFGALLVEPDDKDADLATMFIHNAGYSTMCGHAVIALGRYAVDSGLVRNPSSPETRVAIQCPCGLVEAFVEYKGGKTGNVRFNSVPAFVFATSKTG